MWKSPETPLARTSSRFALRSIAAAMILAGVAVAQCTAVASSQSRLPGCNTRVNAIRQWDPDGAGPRTPVTVFGGDFRFAGDVESRGLAAFDPVANTWSALGPAADRAIAALAVLPSGELVAAGAVNFVGSVETWDGTTWRSLVSSANDRVLALAVMPNGNLVAGGAFTSINGVNANYIARWDGTTWSPLGAGLDGRVWALAVAPNGDLLVGGEFLQAGGAPALRLARWDGSSWSQLAAADSTVRAIAHRANGELVVGGFFSAVNGVTAAGIAVWDGVQWSGLGNGTGSLVTALQPLPNGDLAVGGNRFYTAQVPLTGFALWNGTSWNVPYDALGGAPPLAEVQCLAVGANGEAIVGGLFDWAGSLTVGNVAKWDGIAWRRIASGFYIGTYCVAAEPGDGFAVGLEFRGAADIENSNVVRYQAGSWSAVGNGVPGKPRRIASLQNGRLVVATLNPANSYDVYEWDGSAWSLRAGSLAVLPVIQSMPDGSFVLAGSFASLGGVPASNIARWDGVAWQPLGSGTNAPVQALALMPDGTLIAGGSFTSAGGVSLNSTAKWDGTAWSSFAAIGTLSVNGLSVSSGGDLFAYAAGLSSYRWTGSAWSSLGLGTPQSTLLALPDGSVLQAGGRPIRWNGTAWGFYTNLVASRSSGTALLTNGDVVMFGPTTTASLLPTYFTRLTLPCRSLASPSGSGCLGASLRVGNGAWIGGTCRVRGEGLGAAQLVLVATGFQSASIGLDTLLPQGVAGCTLQLVEDPGLTQFAFANGGVAESSLVIPRNPVFVGLSFRQQMIPVQFDAQGAITAVTSTNAIQHVIGSY